jgi:hypothetical protein
VKSPTSSMGFVPKVSSHRTLRWREMDSNFQYAGAVNLVVGPFGWVVLYDRVRVRAKRFWDRAVSATRLGDLSRRRRGGPPHRSIDEGSVFRVEHRVAGAMAPDRRDRPISHLAPDKEVARHSREARPLCDSSLGEGPRVPRCRKDTGAAELARLLKSHDLLT